MENADPHSAPPPAPKSNRAAMMIVFLVVFIDLLGFGIVLPLLPRIAKNNLTHLIAITEPKTIGAVTGLLMSSFSLMQFLFAPSWGRLSDRIGRRPVLLVGLLGSVVFYAVLGVAASIAPVDQSTALTAMILFFVARIGAGISGATIATAQAVIADCTPPERRKHGMALIGAAFGIGFTFGPLIGFGCLWVSEEFAFAGLGSIGYSASILSLVALLLGLRLLPETRVAGATPTARRQIFDLTGMKFALGNAAIGPVVLVFFLASLGFGAFEVTLSVFLQDTFRYDERYSFLFFAYVGVVLMITQGFLYRRLASRVTEVAFMAMGIVLMAVGVGVQGWICYAVADGASAPSYEPHLIMALTAAVIGFAFLTPSAQALVSRRTPGDRQGEILGVNQAAAAMARILGPLFGMILYQSRPDHTPPYIAGAILLLLMLPLLPLIKRGG